MNDTKTMIENHARNVTAAREKKAQKDVSAPAEFSARSVYRLLGRIVRTHRGSGILLQAFDARCMIGPIDSDGKMSKTGFFVRPDEILLDKDNQ